jgi:hypothetical protein
LGKSTGGGGSVSCFSRHSRTTEDFVVQRTRLALSSRASSRSGNFSEIVVMALW